MRLNMLEYLNTFDTRNVLSLQKYSFYFAVKRVLEIFLSLLLLFVTLPIAILVMIAIKLESKGPIFYKQERVGLNGEKFFILKFRSMFLNAEENGPKWAQKDDPRVTKVGKVIRKFRIDELPQLLNVLKGEMSLIGPRPEREFFTEEFSKRIPGFKNRLLVRPGITGWAQVNGGYDITPFKKFMLDMYYINNQSLKLDLIILLKTLVVIFTGNGAR